MTTDYDPQDSGDYYQDYPYHRRGISLLGLFLIGLFAVASFWLALVATSPLYAIVLPGNENFLGGVQVINPVSAPEDKPAAESIDERINILFLGLDRRFDEAEDEPYRTDSVMVLTIDPYSKTAGAFSIPRDTRVEIDDANGDYYTEARINEVYEFGEYPTQLGVFGLQNYPGGGPGLAMDTVERQFNIPIDHYILMDWNDFTDIIDTIGGVDIDVPEYAYDPIYSTCAHCGEEYSIEFLPGMQHMDGDTALAYARIRHSDNDFKRIERQQLVLKAMVAKAANVETIVNDPVGLYNQFKDAVQTDISSLRAGGLALLMKQVGTTNIRTVSMEPATYPCDFSECGGAAELNWDPDIAAQLIAQVFNDSLLQNENASVAVLNATPQDNMAGAFSRVLKINGIAADRISIDEFVNGTIYDTTLIIDNTGTKEHTLNEMEGWLGITDARVIPGTDPVAAQFLTGAAATADIVVVLGSDVSVDFNGDFSVGPTATAE